MSNEAPVRFALAQPLHLPLEFMLLQDHSGLLRYPAQTVRVVCGVAKELTTPAEGAIACAILWMMFHERQRAQRGRRSDNGLGKLHDQALHLRVHRVIVELLDRLGPRDPATYREDAAPATLRAEAYRALNQLNPDLLGEMLEPALFDCANPTARVAVRALSLAAWIELGQPTVSCAVYGVLERARDSADVDVSDTARALLSQLS